jgi:hypothetical protein
LFTSSRAGKEKLDFGEGAVEIRSAENKAQVRFVAFAHGGSGIPMQMFAAISEISHRNLMLPFHLAIQKSCGFLYD